MVEMAKLKDKTCDDCGKNFQTCGLETTCSYCLQKRGYFALWIIATIGLSIGGVCFAPAYAVSLLCDGFNRYERYDMMWSVFTFLLALLNLITFLVFLKSIKKKT